LAAAGWRVVARGGGGGWLPAPGVAEGEGGDGGSGPVLDSDSWVDRIQHADHLRRTGLAVLGAPPV